MSFRRRLTNLVVGVLLLVLPHASSASLKGLQQDIQTITSDLTSEAGIQIVSLDRKEALFSKNEKAPLNPASVTKLVTTAAALKYLGPDFRFHTKFYISPQNDLYIYGEGDPSIIIEELKTIANAIRNKGVKNIRHIIVNDSYFDSYTSPGLTGAKSHYNSYTGALSLNFNRIRIHVTPARKVGETARVAANAGKVTIDINNKVKTSRRRSGLNITFSPPRGEGEDLFAVSGHIPISSKARSFERHVGLPPLYFAQTLATILEQMGCKFSGSFYSGPKPKGARLILDHESKPLSLILGDMNKFSNNFIAEQLVKSLGAAYLGPPGSTAKGIEVFKKYLSGLGINPRNYTLVNGSGLTYDNRISAADLSKVIQDMYDHPKLWPHFRDSLSIAGKDGTLRRRYRSSPLYGKLRAKTGTVDSVRAIAGTVPSAGGETIGFAILLNGSSNISKAREVQTKIAQTIAEFKR